MTCSPASTTPASSPCSSPGPTPRPPVDGLPPGPRGLRPCAIARCESCATTACSTVARRRSSIPPSLQGTPGHARRGAPGHTHPRAMTGPNPKEIGMTREVIRSLADVLKCKRLLHLGREVRRRQPDLRPPGVLHPVPIRIDVSHAPDNATEHDRRTSRRADLAATETRIVSARCQGRSWLRKKLDVLGHNIESSNCWASHRSRAEGAGSNAIGLLHHR
jgi:hypothetical protein